MVRNSIPVSIGGRDFMRADFRIKKKGGDVWEARFVTFARNYFLVLEIGAGSREELDRLAQQAIAFSFSPGKE
jgi:hypothetical protein